MAKKLSLKPIEKALKQILKSLEKEAHRKKPLTPKQRQVLARDIRNVKKLIKSIPPNCYFHTPPYDLGI